MEHPRLLTVKQVCEELQLGKDRVWALIRSGQIGSIRMGRIVRVPSESVDAFVARAVAGEVPEAAPVWMSHRSAPSSPASTRS